jgi:hypothetical protein
MESLDGGVAGIDVLKTTMVLAVLQSWQPD